MTKYLSVVLALAVIGLFVPVNFDVGPAVVRLFDVLMILGVLSYAGGIAVTGRIRLGSRWQLLKEPLAPGTAIYLLYITVNGYLLSGVGVGLKETVQNLEMLLLFLLVSRIYADATGKRVFVRTLVVGSVVVAVLTAGWHVATGHFVNYKQLGEPKLSFGVAALGATVYWLADEDDALGQFASFYAPVLVLLMLLSGERKGWVAFSSAVAALLLLMSWRRRSRIFSRPVRASRAGFMIRSAILVVGLFIVVFAALRVPFVKQQVQSVTVVPRYVLSPDRVDLSTVESPSNRVRLFLLFFTARTVQEHPWVGIGTDRFLTVAEEMARTEAVDAKGAHSEYQRMAVENGLIGLGLYLWLWWLVLRSSVDLMMNRTTRLDSSVLFIIGLAFYGSVINFFLGGGVSNRVFLILPMAGVLGLRTALRSSYPKDQ